MTETTTMNSAEVNHTVDAPSVFEKIALVVLAIGALNWGLIGLFDFNLVSTLFGVDTLLTDAVYILVAISGFAILRPLLQKAY